MVRNSYLEEITTDNGICPCLAETEFGKAREEAHSAMRACYEIRKHFNLENPSNGDLPMLKLYREEAEALKRKVRDYNVLLSEYLQQGKLLRVFHQSVPDGIDYSIAVNCAKCNQQIDVIDNTEIRGSSNLAN